MTRMKSGCPWWWFFQVHFCGWNFKWNVLLLLLMERHVVSFALGKVSPFFQICIQLSLCIFPRVTQSLYSHFEDFRFIIICSTFSSTMVFLCFAFYELYYIKFNIFYYLFILCLLLTLRLLFFFYWNYFLEKIHLFCLI